MIVNTEAGNIREVYQISLVILRVGTSVAQSSYYLHAFSSSGKQIDHADLAYIIAEECCKNTAKMMNKYQFLHSKKVLFCLRSASLWYLICNNQSMKELCVGSSVLLAQRINVIVGVFLLYVQYS